MSGAMLATGGTPSASLFLMLSRVQRTTMCKCWSRLRGVAGEEVCVCMYVRMYIRTYMCIVLHSWCCMHFFLLQEELDRLLAEATRYETKMDIINMHCDVLRCVGAYHALFAGTLLNEFSLCNLPLCSDKRMKFWQRSTRMPKLHSTQPCLLKPGLCTHCM